MNTRKLLLLSYFFSYLHRFNATEIVLTQPQNFVSLSQQARNNLNTFAQELETAILQTEPSNHREYLIIKTEFTNYFLKKLENQIKLLKKIVETGEEEIAKLFATLSSPSNEIITNEIITKKINNIYNQVIRKNKPEIPRLQALTKKLQKKLPHPSSIPPENEYCPFATLPKELVIKIIQTAYDDPNDQNNDIKMATIDNMFSKPQKLTAKLYNNSIKVFNRIPPLLIKTMYSVDMQSDENPPNSFEIKVEIKKDGLKTVAFLSALISLSFLTCLAHLIIHEANIYTSDPMNKKQLIPNLEKFLKRDCIFSFSILIILNAFYYLLPNYIKENKTNISHKIHEIIKNDLIDTKIKKIVHAYKKELSELKAWIPQIETEALKDTEIKKSATLW